MKTNLMRNEYGENNGAGTMRLRMTSKRRNSETVKKKS